MQRTLISFARRAPAALLFVLFALGAAPVAAQQTGTTGPAATEAPADGADSVLAPLLEVLRDDAARERLIAELEAAVGDAAGGEGADGANGEADRPVDPVSIGRQLALTTQAAVESIVTGFAEVGRGLARGQSILSRFDAETRGTILEAARELLLAILITVGTFLVLRRVFVPVFKRLGRYARSHGPLPGLGAGVLGVLIDVGIVLAAWAIGYAVVTAVLGEFGRIDLRQTLYLNAFLAVELVKVAARAIISPTTADLRVLRVSDLAARRVSRVTNVVVSLLGYGQLLVMPIVNTSVGYFEGRAVAIVISVLAVLYLVAAVLRYRSTIGDWLVENLLPWRDLPHPAGDDTAAEGAGTGEPPAPQRAPANGAFATAVRLWWLPAIGFLLYVLFEALTQPIDAVIGTLVGTLKVAAAVVAGTLVSRALTVMMARGVRVPPHIKEKIPLIENRINALVPNVLAGLRALVILAVLFYALDTIGLFGAWSWLGTESGERLIGTVIVVGLILIVAYAIWVAFSSWVEYRLNPDYGTPPSSRETTLLTLLRNAVTVALIIITLMFALAEMGLNIGPLIASAGVLGLAIGFGAQKLVQDIITGVFIQFENAINVGDVVTVGGITGGVERLTVRSVTLRDLQGIVHIVPFSSVDMVSNFTREFSYYVVDLGIAYREDVDEAKQAMFDAYELLRQDPEQGMFLLGDLEYFGLDAFGDSAVVLKCRLKTWPGKQWGVGRAYNRYLKKVFDERGIEIPFPHQTLYFGEAKDGSVQTLPIRQVADARRSGGDGGRGGGEIRPDDGRGKPTDDAPLGDDD